MPGHCLVLDSVYRCNADGAPSFVEAAAPTDEELHALLQTAIARLMRMLTRRGVLVEDMGQTWLAVPDGDGEEARTLRPLQAAAATYRIALLRADLMGRYRADGQRSLADVSALLGFSAQSALSRSHRQRFGIPARARC